MAKNQSLADKLAALTNPTPEFNQENDEDEDNVTGAKVTEGDYDDDDVGGDERSYLRTKNAPSLDDDSRYQGKKIKRKDYQKDRDFMEHSNAELGHMFAAGDDEDDDEEDEDEEDQAEDDEEEEEGVEIEREEDRDIDREDEENNADNDDDEDDSEDDDEEEVDDTFDVDISSFAPKGDGVLNEPESAREEKNLFKVSESDSLFAKSQAVTSQLACWDKLLEQRIMLQKMLTKVNTFPLDVDSFVDQDDPEHVKLVNKANKSLSSLLLKSVQLKHCIDRKGIEETKIMKRKLEDMSDWLEQDHEQGENKRRERIEMWSDRTQRLGSMGSMNTPTLEQIDQIVSNMPRLVKRTKVARVECNILGEERKEGDEQEQENVNIFDDSDFYHHLLRELIEKKTSSNTESGEVGKHWLQIQKLRSKLKKKVDTRASKGRKVRYDIHTKLVNFMAPVRVSEPMADSARQELFSSLFDARRS